MHHNLHQHVSNEISTASSLSAANQTFLNNNKNLTCVPCAYSNDVRPTTTLMGLDPNGEVADSPVSVVVKKDSKSTNPVLEQLKSN